MVISLRLRTTLFERSVVLVVAMFAAEPFAFSAPGHPAGVSDWLAFFCLFGFFLSAYCSGPGPRLTTARWAVSLLRSSVRGFRAGAAPGASEVALLYYFAVVWWSSHWRVSMCLSCCVLYLFAIVFGSGGMYT